MTIDEPSRKSSVLGRIWPWAILALTFIQPVWEVVEFPHDVDGEYPRVVRPTFNARPPSAYRLAEPGDTIDKLAVYASAAIIAIAVFGWCASRKAGFWPAAIALGVAAGWFAMTPGPGYDGWHGLGWRAIGDRSAPLGLRIGLAVAALGLVGVVLASLRGSRLGEHWGAARERGIAGLLVVAALFVGLRAVEVPGVEPVGYWPRWALFWGLTAFALALLRVVPRAPLGRTVVLGAGLAAACGLMIVGGRWMIWYHRPLERLRPVVPGRIYISAMPTGRGLEIEYARVPFKTIINLFPEESRQDHISARLPEELKFAEEHGIRYIGAHPETVKSDQLLDETLALAQDPAAWPILIHCHGCMDRSPAWMGIYRFVVQGRPLLDIMKEIEAHRGVRPKASITLLFNRVLAARAPELHAADPTARLLKEYARGAVESYDGGRGRQTAKANRDGPGRVPRR